MKTSVTPYWKLQPDIMINILGVTLRQHIKGGNSWKANKVQHLFCVSFLEWGDVMWVNKQGGKCSAKFRESA